MPIVVDCPGCRKRYEVDASLAGKKSRCKLCGEVFRLPVPEGKVIETVTQPKPPPSPQRAARESFLDNQAPAAGDSRASAKGASNANRGTSAGRPISVNCPGCGRRYEIDAALAGKKSRCKQCGEVFSIPVPMGIVTEPPTKPARATSPPTPNQQPATDLLFDDDEPVAFKRAQSTAAPVDEEDELPPPRRMSYPKPFRQSSAAGSRTLKSASRSPAGSWHSMPWRFSVSGFFARSPARYPARPRWSSRATCSPCHSLA